MSFIGKSEGKIFAPGWFLADCENCTRVTQEMKATGITADSDGQKIVKMGSVYPSNDSNAIGIVYEDINVTNGNAPGSVVTRGVVYENRLSVSVASAAKTALAAKGIIFI